tara:strand:- start:3627 stop:3938 length:312 start_codon:yes stop_codon:yes gene_type:complete
MSDEELKAFVANELQKIEIEELKRTIYFYPMNIGDMYYIRRKAGEDEFKFAMTAIIHKCLKKDGSKMWSLDDLESLEKLPVDIVNKIIDSITGNHLEEDIKKN